MPNINGLRIALCQMESIPLNPIANAKYMIREIQTAWQTNQDVIVFPEVCIHDYLNGDAIESLDLLRDIDIANRMVEESTRGELIAIFGSVHTDWEKKGEDGRVRKSNAGFVAQGGRRIGVAIKALLPKYRMFSDARHFFSLQQIAVEISLETGMPFEAVMGALLVPFNVPTRIGRRKFGVTLCEDMWKDDYSINPAKILVENGADVIFNLSASPWTWRKNAKRHRVVKGLFPGKRVPFVYVNKVGFNQQDNSGFPYDGVSTVYNERGEVVYEVPQYFRGTKYVEFRDSLPALKLEQPDDSEQLFLAARCAVEGMLKTIPANFKILVGLSGGIDSAVSAALFAHVAGPDRVIGVNMPYKDMNSAETKDDAEQIAKNLGIRYIVVPINEIVDAAARAAGVSLNPKTPEEKLALGNIMARCRMEILAALCQTPGQSAVFLCNTNKVEAAFSYGTMYGDIAGWVAILKDLVKREVYQLGDYLNRKVYGFDAIPRSVFERPATAELEEGQSDPFDYGSLTKRGYHDEMVRALTEFRWDWSDFLDRYLNGTLESDLLLSKGSLARLFPTPEDFVQDLELQRWRYYSGYRKRYLSPLGVTFTRRSFGGDLRESIHAPAPSQRYLKLREEVLALGAVAK